jgi:CRISPR-associated Csx3 family protein
LEQQIINLERLYKNAAKLADLNTYVKKALNLVGEGNDIILTGRAPVWLYLKVAHALHGKATKLIYRSPVTGDVVIFDHSPF